MNWPGTEAEIIEAMAVAMEDYWDSNPDGCGFSGMVEAALNVLATAFLDIVPNPPTGEMLTAGSTAAKAHRGSDDVRYAASIFAAMAAVAPVGSARKADAKERVEYERLKTKYER